MFHVDNNDLHIKNAQVNHVWHDKSLSHIFLLTSLSNFQKLILGGIFRRDGENSDTQRMVILHQLFQLGIKVSRSFSQTPVPRHLCSPAQPTACLLGRVLLLKHKQVNSSMVIPQKQAFQVDILPCQFINVQFWTKQQSGFISKLPRDRVV